MTSPLVDTIRVGANGRCRVAPVGTPVPTDFASVVNGFPAPWVDLGRTTADGATVTDTKTITDIAVWQSFYPARKITTARQFQASFDLVDWTRGSFGLAFGGGTWTETAPVGGTNAVQTVTISGAPTSGSLTFGFGGLNANPLTFSASTLPTASAVANAVNALNSVPTGSINVALAGSVYTFTFTGPLANRPLPTVTVTGTFTGGSSPAAVAATTTAGVFPTTPSVITWHPPAPSAIDLRTLAVDWQDNAHNYRFGITGGVVTGNVQSKIVRNAAAGLPIQFDALGFDGGDPWFFMTDDPTFFA